MPVNLPQVIIIDEATEIDVIAFKKFMEKRSPYKKRGKWVAGNRKPANWITWNRVK